mmetsp:Transcript_7677/g.31751  ORF Transcript_7677/g.31751 Transcript_7677/m.31751 type:complete len:173 (+) Transcript_7677:244-762(+)
MFGDDVPPIAANAPVAGDAFSYHVDADPYLAPPSPWRDFWGAYVNRAPGRPRLVSALCYLDREWRDEWGAPTRFRDPPTGALVDVLPRPGRLVLLDQDISHTVVAPSARAGPHRPRLSLVLKLVLHPGPWPDDRNPPWTVRIDDGTVSPHRVGSAERTRSKRTRKRQRLRIR